MLRAKPNAGGSANGNGRLSNTADHGARAQRHANRVTDPSDGSLRLRSGYQTDRVHHTQGRRRAGPSAAFESRSARGVRWGSARKKASATNSVADYVEDLDPGATRPHGPPSGRTSAESRVARHDSGTARDVIWIATGHRLEAVSIRSLRRSRRSRPSDGLQRNRHPRGHRAANGDLAIGTDSGLALYFGP